MPVQEKNVDFLFTVSIAQLLNIAVFTYLVQTVILIFLLGKMPTIITLENVH